MALAGRLAGPAAQHSAAASPSPSPSSRRAEHDSIATLLEDTNKIDRTTVQFPFSNPNWQTQNSIVQFNPPCSAAAVAAALPLSTPVSPRPPLTSSQPRSSIQSSPLRCGWRSWSNSPRCSTFDGSLVVVAPHTSLPLVTVGSVGRHQAIASRVWWSRDIAFFSSSIKN